MTIMYDEIFSRLKEIMNEEVGLDTASIKPDAMIVNDLDINSLEFMNLVMVIEEEFDVFLDENRLRGLKTVDDLVSYLTELKNA